jgi:transposase InsO family protein
VRPKVKYAAIFKHCKQYPVSVMCSFFEVSRSGYYDFVKNIGNPDPDDHIVSLIRECQKSTKSTYGYRRVKLWLERETGQTINHKTVLRLMNKYGLLAQIRRRRKYKQCSEYLHKYDNVLNRDFKAIKPNQKWVTDISYIQTGKGVLYLSIIKDLFDNSIVAYKMSTEQSIHLVLRTITTAKQKEKVTEELHLHSDQGFQYTSHGYFNLTQEYGITPSMSRRGNCYDNAPAENFFGILKSECINRRKLKTVEEAKQIIDNYIYFYNYERIQLKTKLTPYEKRCQFN